uniref:NADH dehydrogenase subunit 3 n=1 Tax=Pentidionis agamae TaxID=3091002 RepID=UPI0030029B07|nr:NADH dehydrogenase subunit 3 [Pentidionis agamae]
MTNSYSLMLTLTSTILLITMLVISWMILSSFEKEKQTMNSPFESGFEGSSNSFIPFSSQYFMVALTFLIFDLEIMMTLPTPISSTMTKSTPIMSMFLMILTIMLILEMKMSSIEWVK